MAERIICNFLKHIADVFRNQIFIEDGVLFKNIADGIKSLDILAKGSIVNVCQGFEYASDCVQDMFEKNE